MGAQISDLRYENGVLGVTQVVTLKITPEKTGVTERTLSIPYVNGFRGFDEAFESNFSSNDFEITLRKDDDKLIFILDAEIIVTSITATFGFVTCKPVGYNCFQMIEGVSLEEELENRVKKGRIFMEQIYLPFEVKNQCKR
jgi:hypothetical protein